MQILKMEYELSIEIRNSMVSTITKKALDDKRAKGYKLGRDFGLKNKRYIEEVKMPKISVIVPVYNIEQYLPQCLDSIINQTFKDIEIICINDGSTDGSGQILEQYASQDSRIKVINQENLGVSVARNVGIDTATGEYLSFIDGDDWLDIEAYQNLVACLTPQTDILFFNNRCACVDGSLHKNNKKIDISKVADFEYRIQKLCSGVTNSIVRKSIIEKYGVRFSQSVCFGEDGLFMMELMIHNPYVSFNDGCYYNYRFARPNIILIPRKMLPNTIIKLVGKKDIIPANVLMVMLICVIMPMFEKWV